MSFFMIDIEADGPIPGDYSMISIGAVLVNSALDKTFYGTLKPISQKYSTDALAITGFTREESILFDHPEDTMMEFYEFIEANTKDKATFISDNNGFDWMFVNWYFHHFIGKNPFGYSSQNLGSLYKGLNKDLRINFKHLRKTPHTHNALDDAKGNAEAMLQIAKEFNLAI